MCESMNRRMLIIQLSLQFEVHHFKPRNTTNSDMVETNRCEPLSTGHAGHGYAEVSVVADSLGTNLLLICRVI